MYYISTEVETQITASSIISSSLAIFKNVIVWEDYRNWNSDIYMLRGDGVGDNSDNCPDVYNPDQLDIDGDGIGYMCDPDYDPDGDGIPDNFDNCPSISNLLQTNTDEDETGDVCDPCTDTDGDGYGNPTFTANTCPLDNCPGDFNPNQTDSDNNGIGDDCENAGSRDDDNDGITEYEENVFGTDPQNPDTDGDGVDDLNDAFPLNPLETRDSDGKEIQITTNTLEKRRPAISGNYIVWEERRNNATFDLYMYDISTGLETLITPGTETSNESHSTISGNRIVWRDMRNQYNPIGNHDIYMYDISTESETQITTNDSMQLTPDISGDRIVWTDKRHATYEIYAFDISTGIERRITDQLSNKQNPHISVNRIVWRDDRNGKGDVFMYDISTDIETQISSGPLNYWKPIFSGNRIVYYDNSIKDTYIYNISTSTETRIPYSDISSIHDVSGDRLVVSHNSALHIYNLTTDVKTQISSDGGSDAAISGHRVVWISERSNYSEIYLYTGDGVGDNFDNCPLRFPKTLEQDQMRSNDLRPR